MHNIIGVDRIDSHIDGKIKRDFKFNEDGTGRWKFDLLDKKLSNAIKCIICSDMIHGTLGTKDHLYMWINRPHKNGNQKVNYRKL